MTGIRIVSESKSRCMKKHEMAKSAGLTITVITLNTMMGSGTTRWSFPNRIWEME